MLTNAQLIKRLIEGTELSVIKNSFKIDSCSTKLNIDSECLSVFTAIHSTSLNFDSECRTLFTALKDLSRTRNGVINTHLQFESLFNQFELWRWMQNNVQSIERSIKDMNLVSLTTIQKLRHCSISLSIDSECRTLLTALKDPFRTWNWLCQHPSTIWVTVQLLWTLILNAEQCSLHQKDPFRTNSVVVNTFPQNGSLFN